MCSLGATGVWCAIPDEGASTGHGSSLLTLTNLARIGNPHARAHHDFVKLRQAAIEITTITTGAPPHPRAEIYGERALDAIWTGQ